jgi:hypothetical protein
MRPRLSMQASEALLPATQPLLSTCVRGSGSDGGRSNNNGWGEREKERERYARAQENLCWLQPAMPTFGGLADRLHRVPGRERLGV